MAERDRTKEREQTDRSRVITPRIAGNPKQGQPAYTLIVPAVLARELDERGTPLQDFSFVPEVTDDGILYRITKRSAPADGWA
jgi:hypothetical protein